MLNKILLVVWIVLSSVALSWASDEKEITLDSIVVTPYRYAEKLNKTASSATVITQNEIKNSDAKTVVDALRPVSGIVVRDFYGNGAKASVDMLGFGEQAALNVLVLIDGRRANNVDLSGVDWSQIPIDQVERIEVIRGGSAGVLYGDNASSGVINIITKKGVGKPRVDIDTEFGSYDMYGQKLSLQGAVEDKFSYLFNIGHESIVGYRESSFNKANDFASKLEYSLTDTTSIHFNSGFHASSYGLPSGLFQHHIDERSRRWTRYDDDHADNKDFYFVVGNKTEFINAGSLDIDFSFRENDTDSYFLTSQNDTRKNKLETFGLTPKYTLSKDIAGHDNKFITGIDLYRVLYSSNNFPYADENTRKSYTNIHKNSIGTYLQDEFSLTDKLTLIGGYRYEVARYTFAYHDFTGFNPDRGGKLKPSMKAFNSGIAYTYREDSVVFLNTSKSFRFPQVDEFTGNYDISFHQFLNTDLKPQSAINYQLGARHKFNDTLKGSLSIFRMRVKDYIYFNPTGGIWGFGENENYDKTIHEGLESSVDVKLTKQVSFFGTYTYTKAIFNGGQYDKNDIPMVPRHKGSVGLRLTLPNNLTLNLIGNYVGKRYFINDQTNSQSRLNGYMVADTNISWEYKKLTVTFGINNIFDKEYSEYGVYGSDSSKGFAYDKCYFPSPERNFNLKVTYSF